MILEDGQSTFERFYPPEERSAEGCIEFHMKNDENWYIKADLAQFASYKACCSTLLNGAVLPSPRSEMPSKTANAHEKLGAADSNARSYSFPHSTIVKREATGVIMSSQEQLAGIAFSVRARRDYLLDLPFLDIPGPSHVL